MSSVLGFRTLETKAWVDEAHQICTPSYKSYKTSLKYSPGLFTHGEMAFCPFLAFHSEFYDLKWVRFSLTA